MPAVSKKKLKRKIAALLGGLLIGLLLVELGAQTIAIFLYRKWDRQREEPSHIYERSPVPELVYELKRNTELINPDGRRVRINRHGIRADEDDVPGTERKIALLGDSVTFGFQTQKKTIASLLQRVVDDETSVLNFGVPGFGMAEILAFLEAKDAIYDVDQVVYLLNLNDFSRRDTITEMGGMYRMYRRPFVHTPWMVRKAIYRLVRVRKGGQTGEVPVGLYRWMFEREKTHGFAQIDQMAAYAASSGIEFSIVIVPSGHAYSDGDYALTSVHEEITAHLRAKGIPYVDPVAKFAKDPEYFDGTDHFRHTGNLLMAETILPIIRRRPGSLRLNRPTEAHSPGAVTPGSR